MSIDRSSGLCLLHHPVLVTLLVMKSRSLHCLVCNQTPDQSHSETTTDIFTTGNGELLSKRLERILDARLDSSSCHTRALCHRCHGQVVEIEGYYRVIDEFRHLYQETAGLHKQVRVELEDVLMVWDRESGKIKQNLV